MFTEDLTAFFQTGDFAVAATYNGSATVNGHFDAAYADVLGGIGSTGPQFICAASDVPLAGIGKTLLVNSVSYKIRNREPLDDGAMVRLVLEKQ